MSSTPDGKRSFASASSSRPIQSPSGSSLLSGAVTQTGISERRSPGASWSICSNTTLPSFFPVQRPSLGVTPTSRIRSVSAPSSGNPRSPRTLVAWMLYVDAYSAGAPPNKALELTGRRPGVCEVLQPAGRPARGDSAGGRRVGPWYTHGRPAAQCPVRWAAERTQVGIWATTLFEVLAAAALLVACGPRERLVFSSPDQLPSEDYDWYAARLNAMSQPFPLDGPGESYRFLWIRSFHHPIAISVLCNESPCVLRATELDAGGGKRPDRIIASPDTVLSASQWENFERLLLDAGFWTESPTEDTSLGLDGAHWVLEGIRAGEYRLWSIWSPDVNDRFPDYHQLCLFLVRTSRPDIPVADIY